ALWPPRPRSPPAASSLVSGELAPPVVLRHQCRDDRRLPRVAFVGRQYLGHFGERLRQTLFGRQVTFAAVHHHEIEPARVGDAVRMPVIEAEMDALRATALVLQR